MTFWEMLKEDKEEVAARMIHLMDLGDEVPHWAAPVSESWPGETEYRVFEDYEEAFNATINFLDSEVDYSALLDDEEGEPVDDRSVSVKQFLFP